MKPLNPPVTGWPPVPKTFATARPTEFNALKLEILESRLPGCKLPDDWQGHVFMVNAIGSVASGGLPYPDGDTLFNGDGMIYRFDLTQSGEIYLTSRIAKTPCYYADKATYTTSDYHRYRFRNLGVSRFSPSLGSRNQLNTAFVPLSFGDGQPSRLLVTYDAGRPYEIDTQTLEVVTPVGRNSEWQPEVTFDFPFPPVLSTAHPAFDASRKELYTVNYGRSLPNWLDTIPFFYEIEKLPEIIDVVLGKIAEFFQIGLLKSFSKGIFRIGKACQSSIGEVIDLGIKDFVYLMRWNGEGEIERWQLVLADGTPVKVKQSLHQIGVTQDYIVLMDTDMKVGMDQVFNNPFPDNKEVERLLRNLFTRPVSPDSTIYIVRRHDLKNGQHPASSDKVVEVPVKKLSIPLAAVHFLVDYENPHQQITLHVGHNCAADIAEWVRQYDTLAVDPEKKPPSYLRGMVLEETDLSRLGRYVIDGETGELLASKVICDQRLTWGIGFYTYCDRPKLDTIYWNTSGFWYDLLTEFIFDLYQNYKYRIISPERLLQTNHRLDRPASLFRLETESMTIRDAYQFPLTSPDGHWDSHLVSSPQFVPRQNSNGSSSDGYIICTVFKQDSNEVWIFDAQNLAQGPLCRLGHPLLNLGFTFHTTWLPQIALRTASYYVPVEEDYRDLIKHQSQEIQGLFQTEIYPHFPDQKTQKT